MQRDDLFREQIEVLQATIGAQLKYLGWLRDHMDHTGFQGTDKAYRLVVAAYDATQALSVDLHYPELRSRPARSRRPSPATL